MPTLAHDETKVRPWMHQPKNIKHNIYVSHSCARPNASVIYAHTLFTGVPDVRRLLQPTGSADVSSRVRRALYYPHVVAGSYNQIQCHAMLTNSGLSTFTLI